MINLKRFLKNQASRIVAFALAISMLGSGAALAVDVPDGYVQADGDSIVSDVRVTAPGHEAVKPDDPNAVYDWVIRIHYENAAGVEIHLEEIRGSDKLNGVIPWPDNMTGVKVYDNQNYVLTGFVGPSYVSKDVADNQVDLYYGLDADKNSWPDSATNVAGQFDFEIKYDYGDGKTFETILLRQKPVGTQAIKSVDMTRYIADASGNKHVYCFDRIEARSLFVTNDPSMNKATLYYTLDEDAPVIKPPYPIQPGDPQWPWGYPDWPYWPGNRPNWPVRPSRPGNSTNEDISNRPGHGEIVTKPEKPSYTVDVDLVNHVAYINGYPDGTVRPGQNITRAEVAMILYRLMTSESKLKYYERVSDFTDVGMYDWHCEAIATIAKAGLITGYADNTFRPDVYITRAELAAVISRFVSGTGNNGKSFSDIKGHWAESAINRIASFGWVSGYDNGMFVPDSLITRAEAITIINNLLQRTPDAGHMLPNMRTWIDNPVNAWYYTAVQEATNSHSYVVESFGYEVWKTIL